MIYNIFLDDKKIGTSQLEHADPSMGIVFGTITFSDPTFNFDFFKKYCKANYIDADIDTASSIINTSSIPKLKVFNDNGTEIIGEGCNISGMDSDVYDITIIGIPFPFFEEEFQHHIKTYRDRFK